MEPKKPLPKWAAWVAAAIVLPVICCFGVTLFGGAEDKPAPVVMPKKAPEPTPLETALAAMTPEEDAKREALIEDAQKSGWLGEVDWQRHAVFVGPGFADLDFKMKEAVAWNVVLVAMRREGLKKGSFLGANYDLKLLDQKTGKKLGTYSTLWGKLTME